MFAPKGIRVHFISKLSLKLVASIISALASKTIESVLLQSYKNWEIILVDDASTDNTIDIVKHYTQFCPGKMQFAARQGDLCHGLSASRNRGFAHARGGYIAYLDAGDLWMPDKLLLEVGILAKNSDAAAVMSPVRYFH